jgi:CBS domain-containing protein
MLSSPTVHPPRLSFGEVHALFRDDHLHMALLVEDGLLVAALERADLTVERRDDMPARVVGVPDGRTVGPDATLDEATEAMRRDGRRRLAVVDEEGMLLGLLCLKSNGRGFCTDRGVCSRGDDYDAQGSSGHASGRPMRQEANGA